MDAHLTRTIRRLREDKGVSAGDLDRRIEAHPGTVSKLETGRAPLYAADLYRLGRALDVPVAAFFPDVKPGDAAADRFAVPTEEAIAFAEVYMRLESPQLKKQISDLTKSMAAHYAKGAKQKAG